MTRDPQRGSAIIMLFVAIALFGLLGYAFLQGTRGSTTLITDTASKAQATNTQMCSNVVNMATRRLEAKGCKPGQISLSPDGNNPVMGAPTDGSCSVFHINGGGAKPCVIAANPDDRCTTTNVIGTVCEDGAFYIGGVYGGTRIYARAADSSSSIRWKTTNTATAGTNNSTDGETNTNGMATAGLALHPAAQMCRSHGPEWYVPSTVEIHSMYHYKDDLDLASRGISTVGEYWTSESFNATQAYAYRFDVGTLTPFNNKNTNKRLRCVRK